MSLEGVLNGLQVLSTIFVIIVSIVYMISKRNSGKKKDTKAIYEYLEKLDGRSSVDSSIGKERVTVGGGVNGGGGGDGVDKLRLKTALLEEHEALKKEIAELKKENLNLEKVNGDLKGEVVLLKREKEALQESLSKRKDLIEEKPTIEIKHTAESTSLKGVQEPPTLPKHTAESTPLKEVEEPPTVSISSASTSSSTSLETLKGLQAENKKLKEVLSLLIDDPSLKEVHKIKEKYDKVSELEEDLILLKQKLLDSLQNNKEQMQSLMKLKEKAQEMIAGYHEKDVTFTRTVQELDQFFKGDSQKI